MILRAQGINYTLDNPIYGYISTVVLSLIHTDKLPAGYAIWDNGSSRDYRICKFVSRLNATQTNTLLTIFKDLTVGRGISLTLGLGKTSSCFYPFGPDRGDSGNFGVRLLKVEPRPVMEEPWLYFDTEITLVEESCPAYTLPTQIPEGDLQIGAITDLRNPPTMPESETDYGFSTQLTNNGTAYTIDKLYDADSRTTVLKMVCNQSKAAALINYMAGTVRAANVNIVSQANNYLFGQEGGSSGIYSCQWLNEQIVIKHNSFNEFEFELSFYWVP